jgi:hypothetical protein
MKRPFTRPLGIRRKPDPLQRPMIDGAPNFLPSKPVPPISTLMGTVARYGLGSAYGR